MTENFLRRRINYNRFKKNDAPSKDVIESIIRESILYAPFKGRFPFVNIDVWGPEHQQIKRDLVKTTGVKEAGMKWFQNFHLSDEEWEKKLDLHYGEHPEDFNTQVLAPYLVAIVENPEYFVRTNAKAIYLRVGTLACALAMTANSYGVDSAFCGCLNAKIETRYNKFISDYKADGRDVLLLIGLGYFDFDVDARGAQGGWKKISDDHIEHSGGGRYNIKTRQRESFKTNKPDYDKFVRWQ